MTHPVDSPQEKRRTFYRQDWRDVTARKDLTSLDKLVILYLADCEGPRGICPSLDALTADLGASRDTVSDSIAWLEHVELIRVERDRRPLRYTLPLGGAPSTRKARARFLARRREEKKQRPDSGRSQRPGFGRYTVQNPDEVEGHSVQVSDDSAAGIASRNQDLSVQNLGSQRPESRRDPPHDPPYDPPQGESRAQARAPAPDEPGFKLAPPEPARKRAKKPDPARQAWEAAIAPGVYSAADGDVARFDRIRKTVAKLCGATPLEEALRESATATVQSMRARRHRPKPRHWAEDVQEAAAEGRYAASPRRVVQRGPGRCSTAEEIRAGRGALGGRRLTKAVTS